MLPDWNNESTDKASYDFYIQALRLHTAAADSYIRFHHPAVPLSWISITDKINQHLLAISSDSFWFCQIKNTTISSDENLPNQGFLYLRQIAFVKDSADSDKWSPGSNTYIHTPSSSLGSLLTCTHIITSSVVIWQKSAPYPIGSSSSASCATNTQFLTRLIILNNSRVISDLHSVQNQPVRSCFYIHKKQISDHRTTSMI